MFGSCWLVEVVGLGCFQWGVVVGFVECFLFGMFFVGGCFFFVGVCFWQWGFFSWRCFLVGDIFGCWVFWVWDNFCGGIFWIYGVFDLGCFLQGGIFDCGCFEFGVFWVWGVFCLDVFWVGVYVFFLVCQGMGFFIWVLVWVFWDLFDCGGDEVLLENLVLCFFCGRWWFQ